MTGNDLPANPSVLNTTVLSNFAYIGQLWVVAGLSGICTVPVVREELEHGVDNHTYLRKIRGESLALQGGDEADVTYHFPRDRGPL